MDRDQVISRMQQIAVEQGSQRAAARFLGVSPVYFSDILAGKRDPGEKVLSRLGLEAVVVYVEREEPAIGLGLASSADGGRVNEVKQGK